MLTIYSWYYIVYKVNSLQSELNGGEMNQRESIENLLDAWLKMSICIRGNRIVKSMSFNEILICNILYKHQDAETITATDLCNRTRLLKSQINKILSEMENRNLIERVRSNKDKRKIFIKLKSEGALAYRKEHEGILNILSAVFEEMGNEKVESLTENLNEALSIVDRLQKQI